MNDLVCSIVIYNNNRSDLEQLIRSILNINLGLKLYLVDNSPIDTFNYLETYGAKIEYIHNPSNPGFGKSHNIVMRKAINSGAKYHFIINPDIIFQNDIMTPMIEYMQNDNSIGMMMPQILNLDGTIQNLPKLLPTPFNLLLRKLKIPKAVYNHFINKYELRGIPKDKIYNAPILSGCFTLLNLEAIQKVGMYDDKFFMYFEDWDLSRRVHQHYKTLIYPKVSVCHGYDSGANKNFKLFRIFIKSAIHYFNKWGWFFDKERKQINSATLAQFK